jgi:hypothetical protein
MPLTSKKTAALDTSSTVKAAKQARKAGSTAAANAATAAQSAAVAAQNAAGLAQTAAQNAAVIAQTAAQNATVIATNAAHNAGPAAQTAVTGVRQGVQQGVYRARRWAAPRLDSAADYCAETVAPKVSSALHTAAGQVRPAEQKSKRSSILTWSVLGVAAVAALGAAAAALRYRYRAAIAADSETADEEVLADPTGSQAAADTPDTARPAAAKPSKDEDTETPANGRVASKGW